MSSKRVVITGIGPISSVGIGKNDFWKGIVHERTNLKLRECRIDGKLWDKFYLHQVDGFNISKFNLDKEKLDDIKAWKESDEVPDLNYLIAAIKLALDDSSLSYKSDNNNIGLVLAHENLGLMQFAFNMCGSVYEEFIDKKKTDISKKEFFNKTYNKFLKSFYDTQSFVNLFHVARVFNIHNYSLFINNACASGLYALESAKQIINSNQAEVVVIAAADYPEIYKYIWFRDLGIYSKDGIIRPFCKDSNGLVFGDGGVALVVESLEHAKNRYAQIYAEYLGGGFDLEGWKITIPQIGNNSYQKTINKAFQQSGVNKKDIGLICPHGVSSQPIDYYEAKAITDIFGNNPKKPLITTFKPYVGHNLGGSALLETAILLLSLKNKVIPPTLNVDNIDPKFNISLVKRRTQADFKLAMKLCCAFAGFNSAAIFKAIS